MCLQLTKTGCLDKHLHRFVETELILMLLVSVEKGSV